MDAARAGRAVQYELPGVPEARRWLDAPQVQALPTVDAATHTVQLRIALPTELQGVAPGMFARVWLPDTGAAQAPDRLYVPRAAVVKRAEVNGVYVVDAQGAALLRYVRLGRSVGDEVEVLSGVAAGERVALDPQLRPRARAEAAGSDQSREHDTAARNLGVSGRIAACSSRRRSRRCWRW
jgi:multidrug efflux system membrane fusion protein